MARMSEKEWQAFAASKNLNPDTGKQATDEEPGFISKWELDERMAKWYPPKPVNKPVPWYNSQSFHELVGVYVHMILVVGIGSILVWAFL